MLVYSWNKFEKEIFLVAVVLFKWEVLFKRLYFQATLLIAEKVYSVAIKNASQYQ